MPKRDDAELTARFADMLTAMGTEPRLRIVRLLLAAHPEGLVVSDASLFPTPVGVNPMETILALATRNAERILERRRARRV